jgi:hypothetical protein
MSHSVPSESSATDTTFIVGADLVQFDRHELPIYQTPESRWAEACFDEVSYGAPLDRLFGEPGDVHIDSVPRDEPQAGLTAMPGDDPLVMLSALSDGLILPASEPTGTIATGFDFGADSHAVVHLHDGWSWDIAGADWTFDFHA